MPDLQTVAEKLEALEETIILRFIDRAQFKANLAAYQPGKIVFQGQPHKSLFELRLRSQEEMDAVFGRFEFPEERPFNTGLPRAKRKVFGIPSDLMIADYDKVNLTQEIRAAYLSLVSLLFPAGDDGQYGSSTEHDVYALQAISRRIHFGAMYVAECKYRSDPGRYRRLIENGDTPAIEEHLTRSDVERRICRRVIRKVKRIQAEANRRTRTLIDPKAVQAFYRNTVIPLTKKGEALYLIHRGED